MHCFHSSAYKYKTSKPSVHPKTTSCTISSTRTQTEPQPRRGSDLVPGALYKIKCIGVTLANYIGCRYTITHHPYMVLCVHHPQPSLLHHYLFPVTLSYLHSFPFSLVITIPLSFYLLNPFTFYL